MAVFSTNQARQFYVMKGAVQSTAPTDTNTIQLVTNDPNAPYIIAKGAATTLRSDLLTNIECVKVTDAQALRRNLKSVEVTLASGTNLVVAEDYVIKIIFRQFAGISDEETYSKFASVLVTPGMDASAFYKAMAIALAKNFSKDISKLVKIGLKTSSSTVWVTPTTKESTLSGTYTAVVIAEIEQPWRLGVMASVPVYFDVFAGTVKKDGVEYTWGTVTPQSEGLEYVGNGKTIADLEYFCMGERGDIYRKINWPHNIETTYLVDPTKEYAVLDIHYSYVGSNEGVQKSEKDLTIVTTNDNIAALKGLAKTIAAKAGFANYKLVGATGAVTDESTVSSSAG